MQTSCVSQPRSHIHEPAALVIKRILLAGYVQSYKSFCTLDTFNSIQFNSIQFNSSNQASRSLAHCPWQSPKRSRLQILKSSNPSKSSKLAPETQPWYLDRSVQKTKQTNRSKVCATSYVPKT